MEQEAILSRSFIKQLKRLKLIFIAPILLFLFLAFSNYKNRSYVATARFMLPATDLSDPGAMISSPSSLFRSDVDGQEQNRFLIYGNCLELKDKLASELDLKKHYGITDPLVSSNSLAKSLSFSMSYEKTGELLVRAYDKDSEWALLLAKTVMQQTNELNNNYQLSLLNTKEDICNKHIQILQEKKLSILDSIKGMKGSLKADLYFGSSSINKRLDPAITQQTISFIKPLYMLAGIDDEISKYQNIKLENDLANELMSLRKPVLTGESIEIQGLMTILAYPFLAALIFFFVIVSVIFLYVERPGIIGDFFNNDDTEADGVVVEAKKHISLAEN